MNTANTTRFASFTAVAFALFMAMSSSVSNAAVMESIEPTPSMTVLHKDANAALEPQSIALLLMGMLGLVAVRRMQKA